MLVEGEMGQSTANEFISLLLVEDSDRDARFVSRVLTEGRDGEIRVHRVANLPTAKKVIATQRFDIVILDLDLPESRGSDTVSLFRSFIDDRTPIIALSDDCEDSTGELSKLKGELYCIPKYQVNTKLVPYLLRRLCIGQQAQTSLQRLISTNPDSMVVVNTDGIVLFANSAATELFGRSIDDLLYHQFGVPVVTRGAIEIDIGGHRVAEMRVVEIDWQKELAWLTSLRDITEHKRLENELREAKVAAEIASRAKSQFLSCMSHELRTPLNSVIGFAELIQKGYASHTDQTPDYAEIILSSGLHLLSVVNDILDVSSIESGRITLDCQLFDLGQAISSSLRILSRLAREKGVTLINHSSPIMIPVYADYRRIRQVIINIVSNGIKYTHAGGAITISCVYEESGGLSLKIVDTGIGIAEDHIHKLMIPFARAGDAYTSHQEGAGLGLYISNTLIELHGGKIVISSALKSGTTVSVHFPPERVLPYRI